jgi:hypothetical protein
MNGQLSDLPEAFNDQLGDVSVTSAHTPIATKLARCNI